jgi:hypothetical protein
MNNDLQALSFLIGKDFELEEDITEDSLRSLIIHAFTYLLDHDISRMMNILYRADVDENRLKSLLISCAELPSAEVIADAYILRLKEKVETRKKYRSLN